MIKKKFIIELDEAPALMFIQEKGNRPPKIYQDGKEVKGVRAIRIDAGVESLTTHMIEYATGHTEG